MRCTSCGSDNPEGFRFCGHCGHELRGGCAGCGFANPEGQRFCGRCGTSLQSVPETRPADERAERRLATVMFADVVGFTALAETSDPEAVALRVDIALRAVADIVVAHGGTVDKYLGDALMALFGVPVAHDDDAARAVAAALRVRDGGGELQFSIGINSGEVMVTPVGDGGGITVIGDAVNVASRLESTAGAGEILVGPLTAELVANSFELRERPPALLKGRTQAVSVFEVLRGREAMPRGAVSAPPLVGRQAELDFLRSSWRRVIERSRAQVVLLTGEAGVGKSRLVDEVAEHVQDDSGVVQAACPGYGALVGGRLALELGAQLGADGTVSDAAGLDEQGVWRLRRLIAERATARPLLLVIDDLHHAPAPDLEPLAQLFARLTELPVMVLLAGRPQPADWLGRFSGASTLHLDPLDHGDAVRLARSLAGDLPLDSEAAEALATQAGGNPLHLRELIRLLRSRGALVAEDGAYRLEQRPMLPPTLQAVLAARLDALSAADKAVLQDVAVFSDGANAGEIAAVSGRSPNAALDRLLNAGLVCEHDERFEVEDPLLREVAYEQLPHAARGERHRRAAAVAATDVGRARHLGLAASYLDDPALRAEAAAQLATTGSSLIARSRFGDGIRLVRRAVELGQTDPETLLRLARAELEVGHLAESAALLERIDPAGDPRLAAEVVHTRGNVLSDEGLLNDAAQRWQALGDGQKHAWALANRAVLEFQAGRMSESAATSEAALELFRAAGDREGAAASGRHLALVLPDDPRVPSWLSDALQLAEETGDLVHERNAMIPIAWSRFLRGQLGGEEYTAPALEASERLARVSGEMGDAPFELQGQCMAAICHRLAGRLDEADRAVERARSAGRRLEWAAPPLVEASAYMLSLARGGDALQAPPPPAAPSPIELIAETIVVEAMLLAGAFQPAIDRLDVSPVTAAALQSPFFARLMGAARGAVLVLAGRYDDAEQMLQLALEGARAVRAYPNQVAVAALLAEVHLHRGDRDGAATLLGGLAEDPGGVAGLLLVRMRALLGDHALESEVRSRAQALIAPGLGFPAGATQPVA